MTIKYTPSPTDTPPERITIRDWLEQLENTSLPQNHSGPGCNECPCALAIALNMAGIKFNGLAYGGPTTQAMTVLGCDIDQHDSMLHALRNVCSWNDVEFLSFKQIAVKFRKTYPEIIK